MTLHIRLDIKGDTRVRYLRLLFVLPALGLLAAATPQLQLFNAGGFAAGQWKITPLDEDSKMRNGSGENQCLTAPDMIVHAGHKAASAACEHTIIEDTPNRAIVTYICKGSGYGRTDIRRDAAGVFVVEAQGISGKDPFDMKGEFRRTGECRK